MSGHSKWSTIKHQKGVKDQKRGVVFTKLAKAITVAVHEGSSDDPEMNFNLRLAMERARAANMPKSNIQKAIDRGAGKGEGGKQLKEVTYEGFGPQKTAIIVETLTDNTNRTVSELKKIFEIRGGNLASPGSVSYLFYKIGFILVDKKNDCQEQMLALIDLGATDVEEGQEAIKVYTEPENLNNFKELAVKSGFEVTQMEIIMKPKTTIKDVGPKAAEKITALLDAIDSHDDVQQVWVNFEK